MSRRGPRPAEERLRRLLVMLPWLMERGQVPLVEVAERFGLDEGEVARDLELAAMCGLPPFVDELVDVFIDDGTVFVGVPRLFTRPLRLTSPEAFELLAAARAAMELPGADPAGPLGRGLAKLAAAVGGDADVAADAVTVDLVRPPLADEMVELARRCERVRVTYWSASRDELTERTVTPRRVYADRGNWYLDASDDRSGTTRTFRIDRIEAAHPTGEPGDAADGALPEPGSWFADGSVPRATVRLSPSATWVVERYPVDRVSEPDAAGWITASLPVASERWFERLAVRLGPHLEVVEPVELRDVGRQAARRVLERYRATGARRS